MDTRSRLEKLKHLFRRSSSFRQVTTKDDFPADPMLQFESLFFNLVKDEGYYCECRLGSSTCWSDMTLSLFGRPNEEGLIPNILIQLAADGSLKGAVEETLRQIGNQVYEPVDAIPLFPYPEEPETEAKAEKIVNRVVDELLFCGKEISTDLRPRFLR